MQNTGFSGVEKSIRRWGTPRYRATIGIILVVTLLVVAASASTTELHIVKLAPDAKSVLSERTVDYQWMEANLPVLGDGQTHYYHQGPVFLDDPDPVKQETLRWNVAEDTNVQEKDMGAVKGTAVKDLCDLVGGMAPGDRLKIVAADGFTKFFPYENIYAPTPRQGPMVITWFKADEGYVPDYRTGMRLIFFADTSTNPWGIHAFGNWDWHESADEEYWYFYRQGDEKYPTTTGLSVQLISDLVIEQGAAVETGTTGTTAGTGPAIVLIALGGIALLMVLRNHR